MIHYIYDHGNITKRFEPTDKKLLTIADIIHVDSNSNLHLYFSEPNDKAARRMFIEYFKTDYKAAKHVLIVWVKEDD